MRPVRSHVFRGKRYAIKWRKLRGQVGSCDPPTEPAKEIIIDPSQGEFELLDTLVHEALHAVMWDAAEEAVEESATDIARLLWRMGYRRPTGGV